MVFIVLLLIVNHFPSEKKTANSIPTFPDRERVEHKARHNLPGALIPLSLLQKNTLKSWLLTDRITNEIR